MRTHLGTFGRGQAPIALFAGVRASPGRQGFGAADSYGVLQSDQNPAPAGDGFGWDDAANIAIRAWESYWKANPGTKPTTINPGAYQGLPPGYTPPSTMPKWVVPAAIAGGVIAAGGLALVLLGRKGR